MIKEYLIYLAPLMYAISIYVDIVTYHLKFNLHDGKNYRYLFSLINVFQYTARGFVLIFVPIMAYYTENLKDKDLIWMATLLSHILVVLLLLPLFNRNHSLFLSKFIIGNLNKILGKSEYKKSFFVQINPTHNAKEPIRIKSDIAFFAISYIAFTIFSFSMTFLYYIVFYFPSNVLMLSSYSQILNTFGAISILLFIDPRFMAAIDNSKGLKQLNILTTSRIVAHCTLILVLIFLR